MVSVAGRAWVALTVPTLKMRIARARASSPRSNTAAEMVDRGGASVEEAVVVMRDIYDSFKNSERLMRGLGERFTRIGIIIDVITEIEDQSRQHDLTKGFRL